MAWLQANWEQQYAMDWQDFEHLIRESLMKAQLVLDRNSILVDKDHVFFDPDVFGEFDKLSAIWSSCQMMFT